MATSQERKPIVHFVGSIPLSDPETVFRTLSAAAGPYLKRLPDGETGIRKTWIRFLQGVLAENPAIEVAQDLPPFKFVQWDGKLLREIPRLRLKRGVTPDPGTFNTGYAEMAIESWHLFNRLQREGAIPAGVRSGSAACSKMIVSVRLRIDSMCSTSVRRLRTDVRSSSPASAPR